jgi:multidrug efflux pump subunit AcrA (membrane-fusion protein)
VKRGLWLLAGLVVLAGLAMATPALLRDLGPALDEVPTVVVERGDFVRRIHAEGNLEASDATLLGPPPDVMRPLKIAWLAPEGSRVAAGEVVIRFDPTDLEEELREGKHDAATTDARIVSKSVRDEGARNNMDRDAEAASMELDYAQSFQSKDALIFSRREIVEAEIDETLARQKKEHAQQVGDVHGGLNQAELDLLAIERRKAELKITQAEAALSDLEVEAPHDGIFVLKKKWGRKPEVGQMVWGGNAVAEIPKPEVMQAKVYVLEADAGGLAPDLAATVVIDAHPDIVYEATVQQVAAIAQRRNRRVPIQYFSVTLELATTDGAVMKPGHRVQAEIRLDEQPAVLAVPRQAVFEEDGKKIVYVRRGGGFEPVEVELGSTALGRVVIESGLEGGERIALRNPTRPADDPSREDQDGESSPIS